jgi:endonuclease/exonuclease/phosphatase family metal-dependent hydrolase
VRVRVVTFNIRHGTVGGSDEVDGDRLGEVCASFGADILALQEVDRFVARSRRLDLPAIVAEATGMTMAFGCSQRMDGTGEYGNALFVRGVLREVTAARLPKPLFARGRERRGVISAAAGLADGEVWVVATHISVKPDEQDRQLDAVLERAAEGPAPAIVLGDWNATPDRVQVPVLAAGFQLVDPSMPTFPAHQPRSRIDHIAVRGLEVVDVAVPASAMSDHRPLVVDLARPSTPTVEPTSR